MNITFLGTGSAFNHVDGNNSAWLEFDCTNLLLDCGPSVPRDFEVIGGSVDVIDNIWISHMHGDHIGGLEEIGFKNYFTSGKKANIYIHESIINDLKLYLSMTMKYTSKGPVSVDDYFNFIPVKDEELCMFTIGKEQFYLQRVEHIYKDAPAFYLTNDKFIYTGDTQFIDWSKYDLSKIRAIFQDTQLHDYGDNVHTTLPELLTLPESVRKKIWCMHYGQDISDFKKQIESSGMRITTRWDTMEI